MSSWLKSRAEVAAMKSAGASRENGSNGGSSPESSAFDRALVDNECSRQRVAEAMQRRREDTPTPVSTLRHHEFNKLLDAAVRVLAAHGGDGCEACMMLAEAIDRAARV